MKKMKSVVITLAMLLSTRSFAQEQKCQFTLDQNSVRVTWTAFKTTKKVAVNGSFQKIQFKGAKVGRSLEKTVQGLEVVVDPSSFETGNPARDQTLKEFFFAKLADGAITGSIKNFSAARQSFTLALKFNGETHDIPMSYKSEKDDFTATGELDLMAFHANSAFDSIHQKCFELHKGPDGISKTWPTVELHLLGHVTSACH